MEFNLTNYQQFTKEDLEYGPSNWRHIHERCEDYGHLLEVFADETNIANHFIYFNKAKVVRFDKLLSDMDKQKEYSFNKIYNWFINEDEVFAHNYDNEQELIEDRMETKEMTVDILIGYFRWCVYTEEYEFAKVANLILKDLIKEFENEKV